MKSTAKLRSGSTVTRGQKIALGLGDLGYGIVNNTMNSFILFFGNTVMGVPGTLMGLAVACGTMWDAVTDPLLGYASDNLRSRVFGRRHGFILLGVLLMSVLNVALWSLSPEWSSTAKFFWFVFFIVALETSYTFFATPNSALSLEITNDYNERSSIQIYKSVFTILGILIPTLLMGAFQTPTEAYPDGRFNPDSYRNFSYVGSALDLMGFQEGSSVQTPAVEASLGWLLCLGVIASVGGGILLFSRYRIKRADVQEALEKINRVVIVSSDAESSEGEKRGDA